MNAPCNRPIEREQFWKVYLHQGYDEVQKTCGNNTFKGRVKYRAVEILQVLHIGITVKKFMKKVKG